MKTPTTRLPLYVALMMVLLLSGAVGVIGVDLAQGHHAALQDREGVPLAKEEYSLLRTMASRIIPDDVEFIDDEPSSLSAFPASGISLLLLGLLSSGYFCTRQSRQNITGFFAPCHLQFRFIHSREGFSSIT
ncbi:hypothetical protein K6Q96_18190 [Grimontia kaedaensis]|uniref:Uncharacterized protein n=1 Tax=Grimontia kaedaensis TaxID=2872157 RepID=A0ABY4X1M4_9GAMM|nr:hypothetical protein [Grimontia kaedaensis]USH05151.1 hypothetical protein K6Q96_18190 [Grimontia kaedaensis]